MMDFLVIVLLVLMIHANPYSRLAEIVMLFLLLMILFSIAGWIVLAAMFGMLYAMISDSTK
jgi:hypothetical protein